MGSQSGETHLTDTDRRKDQPTIGYLNMMITGGAWALQPWLGIVDAARERGFNLVTFVGGTVRIDQANVVYDLARGGRLDGLVIWNAGMVERLTEAEVKAFCEQYGVPVVTLEGSLAGFPCVTYENYSGLRRLTEHLIQVHGYQKIGFLGMLEHHEGFRERYRGYVDAMQAHELPVDPTLARPWFPPEQLDAGIVEAHTLNDYVDHAMALGMEAVIGIADDIAYQVLGELEKRGIRVPRQVAVVGFDDNPVSRMITPPLTTVKAPFYEMGYTAAETLIDLLAGKAVPELVSVPADLMVRQSCGCQDPYVAAAATESKPALEMVQATQVGEIEPLFAKFAAELAGEGTGGFLDALGEALQQSADTMDELTEWHGVLSALRQQILPQLTPDAPETRRAEDLLRQAQVLISRMAERTQILKNFRAAEDELTFQRASVSLLTTLDTNTLLDTLANELPGLGIPSCYLSFFEDPRPYQYPDPALEWARLILAYGPQGRVSLESPGRRFPARQLIPDELWPQDRACSFVLLSLHLQEQQMGFVLFESGSRRGRIYETLRTQISSALQGALLVTQVERRALQLQTSAEVSRSAGSVLSPDVLIQQVADLIRERFGLYYVGLFLVDASGRWGELRAGTGEAGQQMVAQGHQLEVGGTSMIGACLADGRARIAQDVGVEAVRFDNPLLPETHSEMALPLASRGEVIGALTIQSSQEAAFAKEDIVVLQTMGDQLANAIANARLYEQAQQAYAEVEQQVRVRTEELRREQEASARLQQEVIEAQQRAIQELSTPIIPVLEGVIVMPLIGSIDTTRARDVTRRLLAGIREHKAKVVILDITGVPVVDSGVAAYLNKTVQAARLKGARTIVTGISEAVAETIVDLGIDWSGIETMRDLQTGLRAALARG